MEEAREDCDRRWGEAEEGAATTLAWSWADLAAVERYRTEGAEAHTGG